MSSRCQCRFSVHADTILGSHRDPISSEKCWLDFAVRELSRVAAGKARGQEAVWRSQCKPAWWDCACPYPWKNPTANPKDSKDTLKAKFECLVQHLRKEGQIPADMVEEIDRWEKGQVQELFLMTSFSCILGQASNLHSVLDGAFRKMEETGISVNHTILTDLRSCLSTCVQKIDTMKDTVPKANKSSAGCSDTKRASCSGQKRLHDESDSDDHLPIRKRSKLSPAVSSGYSSSTSSLSSPPSASSPSSSSHSHSSVSVQSVSSICLSPEQQKLVETATLQKLVLQMSKRTAATLPLAHNHGNMVQIKSASLPRPRQPGQKKHAPVLSNGSLAAVKSVPLTSPSASVSNAPDTTDFVDFLSLDLASNDDASVNDLDFLDKLLEEKSPDVIVASSSSYNTGLGFTFQLETERQNSPVQNQGQNSPVQNQGQNSPVQNQGQNSPVQNQGQHSPVQNQAQNIPSSDPLLCNTSVTAGLPSNIPAPVQMPLPSGADGLDCWGADTVVEDLGIAFPLDARDKDLGNTETISDSDYETLSPISHRSSLDVDPYRNVDLSSPELEAWLGDILK